MTGAAIAGLGITELGKVEGPWLVVRLVGSKDSDDRELRAGLPLVACFLPSGAAGDEPPGEVLPAFTPLAQATP